MLDAVRYEWIMRRLRVTEIALRIGPSHSPHHVSTTGTARPGDGSVS